jgi:Cft2 family RNA processing exonuclease
MGDSCAESIIYAHDAPPPAGTAIVDASYGAYDEPLQQCIATFDAALDAGAVLMPVAPAGRGPEMALHAHRSGRATHIDDALRSSARRFASHDRECLREGVAGQLAKLADEALPIETPRGAMFAAGADANYGAAQGLVARWENDKAPAIIFSGYLTPGTPAERLTRSGRARYLRWNVHPRLSDNAKLVRDTGARQVLPAFGGAKHLSAWQSAFAPAKVILEGRVQL